jgi:hypothetical protein
MACRCLTVLYFPFSLSTPEMAMRDPAPASAVIVGTGDGALGASSKVAMVDRGLDVASLAGNDDAAARRARDQVAGTPSSEAAMLEKKSRLDLGRLSRGRAAVIACNAPGRH